MMQQKSMNLSRTSRYNLHFVMLFAILLCCLPFLKIYLLNKYIPFFTFSFCFLWVWLRNFYDHVKLCHSPLIINHLKIIYPVFRCNIDEVSKSLPFYFISCQIWSINRHPFHSSLTVISHVLHKADM